MSACSSNFTFVSGNKQVSWNQGVGYAFTTNQYYEQLFQGYYNDGIATCLELVQYASTLFGAPDEYPLEIASTTTPPGSWIDLSTFQVLSAVHNIFEPGAATVSLWIAENGTDYVEFGTYDYTYDENGVITSQQNNWTRGPILTIGDLGPDNIQQIRLEQNELLPGGGTVVTNLECQLGSGVHADEWVACIIPACGVIPPGPPWPPYLPYMPPNPTINPSTLPPSPTFPPTRQASRFLAVLANYTVFSDFGSNYGYKVKK